MSIKDELLIEKTDNVAMIRINRPETRNALDRGIVRELDRLLDQISADQEIRALILTGDQNFAAGADIGSMVQLTPEEARAFLFADTFRKLEELEIPTIAAICGYALGGGLELALCCDFRIASENAVLGLPEIGLGIMPGAGGTIRLARIIGEARAKEMIFLGKRWSAEKALNYGLVQELVKEEELRLRAMEFAVELAEKAPRALAAAKKSIQSGSQALESELWAALFATDDQRIGMAAFLQKEKAVFQGK